VLSDNDRPGAASQRRELRNVYPGAIVQPEGAIETSVEIAVVKISAPVNVDKGLAHH